MAFLGFGKSSQQKKAQSKGDEALDYSKLKGNDLWDRSRGVENNANSGMQSGLTDYTNLAKGFTDVGRFNRNQGAVEDALGQFSGRVSGLYDNPGYTSGEAAGMAYTPGEVGGMRYSATAPIAASYAGASGDIARKGAVTNNPIGYGANMGAMARMRGQDLSFANAGVTKGVADVRRGVAQDSANARRQDQQTAIGMSQFPVAQRQNIIEGERGMLPAFQFPAALNAQLLQQMMQTQTANRGVDAGVGMNQSQLAYNPAASGMWGRIFENAMGNMTKGMTA